MDLDEYKKVSREFKDNLFQQFARIGKSLSSEKRLEILNLLSQGPKSVEVLANSTGSGMANVSKHLQALFEARLVKYRKTGTYVYYELSNSAVSDFLSLFWQLGETQIPDIQRFKEELNQNFSDVRTLTLEELRQEMETGEIILLDVRPEDEYENDHIPGAISIPIEELENHLATIPKTDKVIAYCRGPYCIYAAQAVQLLGNKGFNAFRLKEGVLEWRKSEKTQLQ